MDIMSFADALANAGVKPHLLLGNGFSRALFNEVFAYSSLFTQAQNNLSDTAKEAFDAMGTTSFEEVMRGLRSATQLIHIYAKFSPDIRMAMESDLANIRDLLARTIALNHPDRPNSIAEAQYASCRQFLKHFKCIYTCNYDLLLYWTVMQSEILPAINSDDGFRHPDGLDADYVVWEVQNTDSQNIHYLHGALHIYDADHEIKKYTWVRTDVPLMNQIRASLEDNTYPIFVSEGTWQEKLSRIQHSNYLGRSYRSFSRIGGSLFIFGLSLAENDEHILSLLEKNSVKKLYVGVFGDIDETWNKPMVARARQLGTKRRNGPPPEVFFYDAGSAHVWDRPIAR